MHYTQKLLFTKWPYSMWGEYFENKQLLLFPGIRELWLTIVRI